MKTKRFHDKELILRQLLFMVLDAASVVVASVMALLLRFNLSFKEIQEPYLEQVWQTMVPNILTVLVVFWFFRLYHSVWRYAGMYELQQIVLASVTVTVTAVRKASGSAGTTSKERGERSSALSTKSSPFRKYPTSAV